MKKYVFCLMAAASILAACNRENALNPQEAAISNAKSVKVYAGGPGTKTIISETGGQFSLNWSAGDIIAVWEAVPYIETLKQDPEYNGYVSQRYESDPLSAAADAAIFQLNLGDRPDAQNHGDIQYVAVYPAACAVDNTDCWDYEKKRMIVAIDMPTDQNPTADNFDPAADVLVSKAVHCTDERPDQLSFQFARVGTIVKMTVGNLPPGAMVTGGAVDLGFQSGYYFVYDPQQERITTRDGVYSIRFEYAGEGIQVRDDGTVTVWIRSMSGVSRRRLELRLYYTYDGQGYERHRIVNLGALGRTLEFKEGGLTEFSIGVPQTPEADVVNPDFQDVDFYTGDDMGECTVYWPYGTNENLAGYECFMRDEAGSRIDFARTGVSGSYFTATVAASLIPGVYTVYVRALAVEGMQSQTEYLEKELEIGLPQELIINYSKGYGNLHPAGQDAIGTDKYFGVPISHCNLAFAYSPDFDIYGQTYNKPWGLWNSAPFHWSTMIVKTKYIGDGQYAVYASDEYFTDGLPADAVALEGTIGSDGERIYDLAGRKYFLICGLTAGECHFDYINLEYYK